MPSSNSLQPQNLDFTAQHSVGWKYFSHRMMQDMVCSLLPDYDRSSGSGCTRSGLAVQILHIFMGTSLPFEIVETSTHAQFFGHF